MQAESYEQARSDVDEEKDTRISRMPASDDPEKLRRNRKRVLLLLKTMREEKIASTAMLSRLDERMVELMEHNVNAKASPVGLAKLCSCFKRSATGMVSSLEGLAAAGDPHSKV